MRLSQRLPPLGENKLSLALRELRAGGAEIVDLSASNPTAVGVMFGDEEQLVAALGDPRVAGYLPNARGPSVAREAIAEAFAPRFSAEGLLLTASSSEAYALLFKLLCDC
ncbi:MAG: hypothetical protein JRH20_13895, partial [Deltaproteobacteria bacterium]|nr:hypothetical protein [Deltaproteobacteria bacterium]